MAQQARYRILVGAWHMLFQLMAFANATAGGYQTMDGVLRAVASLNEKLKQYGIEICVSAHLNWELAIPEGVPKVGKLHRYNYDRAIYLEDWLRGISRGVYAKIGRVICAGFGYPWSDKGAFTNPDAAVRQLAHDLMVYAFQQSALVKAKGAGLGGVIFWTGPDGIRWLRLVNGKDIMLCYETVPELEEWGLVTNGVGNAVKEARELGYTDDELQVEDKSGGDPCYVDVFTDTKLAITGINAINEIIGAPVAKWQGELAHVRGGGETFANAMKMVIDGGVFGGKIHLNSGGIASRKYSDLLSAPGGTPMSLFQQYVDPDYTPGTGVAEWVEDQINSLRIGAEWSATTGNVFDIEFDARFARDEDTLGSLERSALWTMEQMDKFGAKPA